MEEPEICMEMPEAHQFRCSAEPGEKLVVQEYLLVHSGHSLIAGDFILPYHSCSEVPPAPVLSKGIAIELFTRIFYTPGAPDANLL